MVRYNPYDGRSRRPPQEISAKQELAPNNKLAEGPACADKDPEIFFPNPTDKAGNDLAIAICKLCVEREACLKIALKHPEESGVWGGVGENGRRAMLGKMMRRSDSVY